MSESENWRVVEQFWAAMAANDFRAVGRLLHDEFVLEWPQSGERIRGRDNFVAVNERYPAAGRWIFTVHRVVAGDAGVATDVSVTDGMQWGRAITFHDLRDGLIARQTEYWPEPFAPAEWRAPWMEMMQTTNALHAVKLIPDVPFARPANGRALLPDILRPDPVPTAPMPAVLWLHGGGWREGDKETEHNRILAEHGFFTVGCAYRLSGEAHFPAQIHDVKAAVRWLRANAGEYGVDARRIGVWGGSAGGHLAALLGTSGDVAALEGAEGVDQFSSRVQAVVDICGPVDMLQDDWQAVFEPDSPPELLFGGPVRERVDLARLASPLTHIREGMPPFLIIHGDRDETVPFSQSELLYRALQAVGCDATLLPMRGADHTLAGRWEGIERAALTFFQRHLGDPIAPGAHL